jgi:hypothetical protein
MLIMAGLKQVWTHRLAAAALVPVLAGLALSPQTCAAEPAVPPYLQKFPDFEPVVTPQMPGDVDVALKEKLDKDKKFAQVQREFDLYSWQMFFALNWPTNEQGNPAPKLTDTDFGQPHWTLWPESSTIFHTDGTAPKACAEPAAGRALALSRDLTLPVSRGLTPFRIESNAAPDPRKTRFLGVISAVGERNVANLSEIGQAFTGPLIDQNGNFVYYEIEIDPNEVDYLCRTKLYNINGQVAFSQAGNKVDMPKGSAKQDWSGVSELKFAWKILVAGKDDPSRFYTADALIKNQDADGKEHQEKVQVGLVGMHIGHKSETSPQWIWATFEQVDNLAVDPVAHPDLKPSFNNPNCPVCTVNVEPQAVNGVYPKTPVQVSRAIPIPPDKQHLNAEVAAAMTAAGSVWQYYELIDTQWPTSPATPPANPSGPLPDSVENKPGGDPTPVFLTNITMETYFQGGNQPACQQEEGVSCPAAPVFTFPVSNQSSALNPAFTTQILATESCMGCHSSAGIYTSYDPHYDPSNPAKQFTQSGQLTGDFSWLPSQKAAWEAVAK